MAELIVQWQEGDTQRSQHIQPHQQDPPLESIKIGRNPDSCDVVLSEATPADLQIEIACEAHSNRWYLRWSPPALEPSPPQPIVNGQVLKTPAIVLDPMNTVQLGPVLLNVAIKSNPRPAVAAHGPRCPLTDQPRPQRPPRRRPSPSPTPTPPPPALVGLVVGLVGVIMVMGTLALIFKPSEPRFVDITLEDYEFTPARPRSSDNGADPAVPDRPVLSFEQLETLTQTQLAAKEITLTQLDCEAASGLELGQTLQCQATVANARPFDLNITAKSLEQVALKPEVGVFFTETVETQIRNWAQTQQHDPLEQISCAAMASGHLLMDYPDNQFTCTVQTQTGAHTVLAQVEGNDLTFTWQQQSRNRPDTRELPGWERPDATPALTLPESAQLEAVENR